jgi:hypothetical protein
MNLATGRDEIPTHAQIERNSYCRRRHFINFSMCELLDRAIALKFEGALSSYVQCLFKSPSETTRARGVTRLGISSNSQGKNKTLDRHRAATLRDMPVYMQQGMVMGVSRAMQIVHQGVETDPVVLLKHNEKYVKYRLNGTWFSAAVEVVSCTAASTLLTVGCAYTAETSLFLLFCLRLRIALTLTKSVVIKGDIFVLSTEGSHVC